MKKAAFMTLGCKVNQYETETMEGLFRQAGYEVVPFSERADVYIVNTCSVTSLGEKKSRQLIRRAQRLNPEAVLAVTGCYAQLNPAEIARIDGVRLVIGNQGRENIVKLCEQAATIPEPITVVDDIMQAKQFEDIPLFGVPQRTRAFLKIQEGCQNFCTYCIIPYTRGPLRSRPLESVKRETAKLVKAGFKEIVLTGIHLGAYGRDLEGNITLADAAREVLRFPEIRRLRLGSLESVELSPDLFELIRSDERFAKHLHLPLQAGAEEILHRMNRHYDKAEFLSLIQNVEREIPGVAISTDIIVGFPGETEAMFAESLEYVAKLNFMRMHIFPYSKREGTPAAAMPDQVPEAVKHERVKRMQELAEKKAAEYLRQFIGKTLSVLIETENGGIWDGLTGNYIRVYTDVVAKPGELVLLRAARLYKDGIWGEAK